MQRSSEKLGLGVTLVLVTGVVVELLRVAFGVAASGYTVGHNYTISIVLAVLWGSAAAAFAARHRGGGISVAAWVLTIAGTFAMFAHGFMLLLGNAGYGVLYLIGGALLAALAFGTLKGAGFRRLRREARSH